MTTVRVKQTKKQQIEERRALVLELRSQGMTQAQISEKLQGVVGVSRKNIARDIEYWQKNRVEFVRRNRRQMSDEYENTYNNLLTLRRDIFVHYRKAMEDNDISLIKELVPIIVSIERAIHEIVASGRYIGIELIKLGQERNEELEQRLEQTLARAKY